MRMQCWHEATLCFCAGRIEGLWEGTEHEAQYHVDNKQHHSIMEVAKRGFRTHCSPPVPLINLPRRPFPVDPSSSTFTLRSGCFPVRPTSVLVDGSLSVRAAGASTPVVQPDHGQAGQSGDPVHVVVCADRVRCSRWKTVSCAPAVSRCAVCPLDDFVEQPGDRVRDVEEERRLPSSAADGERQRADGGRRSENELRTLEQKRLTRTCHIVVPVARTIVEFRHPTHRPRGPLSSRPRPAPRLWHSCRTKGARQDQDGRNGVPDRWKQRVGRCRARVEVGQKAGRAAAKQCTTEIDCAAEHPSYVSVTHVAHFPHGDKRVKGPITKRPSRLTLCVPSNMEGSP